MKYEINYKRLRQNLRRAREKKGVSLTAMAEKTGYAEGRLKNVESGRHKPPLEIVYSYAEALSASVDALLGRKLDRPETEEPAVLRGRNGEKDSTYLTFHCTFNKISIHRGCLDLLGRPEFIQILVSPSTKEIALRSAALTEADTFRVIQSVYEPGGQFRIRCDEFLKRLCELMGWSKNYAYRVEGTFSEGGIMLYDLTGASTLEEWDEGECE